MPLFEYECKICGYEFEELLSLKNSDVLQTCKKCGKVAQKKMSRCASVFAGGAPTATMDAVIGRSAEQRWKQIHEREAQRRKGHELQEVKVPQTKDGKFTPVMGLGSMQEQEKRKEFSGALKDFRQERTKRGQEQFDGPGAF